MQGKMKKEGNPLPPRERLYNACNEWADAVEKRGGKFHGGEKPDLADLAGTQHFRIGIVPV